VEGDSAAWNEVKRVNRREKLGSRGEGVREKKKNYVGGIETEGRREGKRGKTKKFKKSPTKKEKKLKYEIPKRHRTRKDLRGVRTCRNKSSIIGDGRGKWDGRKMYPKKKKGGANVGVDESEYPR